MSIFEQLKRDVLIYGLDDAFDILSLITRVRGAFKIDDPDSIEIKNKTLDLIKYLIQNKCFLVGHLTYENEGCDFVNWDLTEEETLLKIKSMWDNVERDYVDLADLIWFDLSPQGREEAKSYHLKQFNISEKIILEAHKKDLTLKDIVELVKKEFNTNDSEEIQFETLKAVDTEYFDIGFIENGKLVPRHFEKILVYSLDDFLTDNWEKFLQETDTNKQLWFRSSAESNKRIEEWKKEGGHFFPKEWYEDLEK